MTTSSKQPTNYLAQLLREPEEKEYYEAVGRLIIHYARAEAAAHVAVRRISNLSDRHARIIFGGMRFGDIAERLRKLASDTQPDNISDDFGKTIDQFNIIGK